MSVTITRRYVPVSLKVWLLHFNFLDNPCRNPADYDVVRNIFINLRSGCDDRIVTDGNSLQDSRIRSDPHILAQHYRSRVCVLAVFGRQAVVQSSDTTFCPIWHPSPRTTPP